VAGSKKIDASKRLIAFLASQGAAAAIKKSGRERQDLNNRKRDRFRGTRRPGLPTEELLRTLEQSAVDASAVGWTLRRMSSAKECIPKSVGAQKPQRVGDHDD
jgi:hypothetical protein